MFCEDKNETCNKNGELWSNDGTCLYRECLSYDDDLCLGDGKYILFEQLIAK